MASIINASKNSGIVSSSDGTNALQLQTYNVPAISVNSSQVATISGPVSSTTLGTGITSFQTPLVTTSGTLTLQSNSTAGLTLDTFQTLRFNSGFGSNAIAFGCRAWVNFGYNGTNIVVRGSGNIASVTRISGQATGVFQIAFINPMPDALYSIVGSACVYSAGFGVSSALIVSEWQPGSQEVIRTNTFIQIATIDNSSDTLFDPWSCNIAIFR